MAEKNKHRYHAFISYAHEDQRTVEWLRKLLATFWVPWRRRRRIFLDQESLPAGGGLSSTLKDALRDSRFLIVCCSEASVNSQWVNLEVQEFLQIHPAKNVLGCLVGPKTCGPFAIPQAVRDVQQQLGDELFTPDLRGNPEDLKRRAQRSFKREALALLAPLVNLPGKDELLDQRKKNLIVGSALLVALTGGAGGWKAWDNRPESQIRHILSESPGLVQEVSTDIASGVAIAQATRAAQDAAIGEWLRTLVLTGNAKTALESARAIEWPEGRFHALVEIADQLRTGGAIRHSIDHRGKRAWEIVHDGSKAPAEPGARDAENAAAIEAAHAARRVIEATRKIADAADRSKLLLEVAGALAKIGKHNEIQPIVQEALEAVRTIPDAGARSRALDKAAVTMAGAGRPREAAQIAEEALAARGGDADGRVNMLVEISLFAEARAAALQLNGPEQRAKALIGIAQAMVQAGQREEAAQTVNSAVEAAARVEFSLRGRYTVHAQIMEMLADSGRTDEALAIARRVENGDRESPLVWIARALANAGKHEDAARVACEALALARAMPDADRRAAALIEIGEALAASGGSAQAGSLAQEALTALGGEGNYSRLDQILALLVKAGKHAEAKHVADRELTAIQALKPGNPSNLALANALLVGAVAKSGTSAETRQAARAALEAAQQRKFEWEANRAWLLLNIVGAVARAGKGDEALESAAEIANPVIRIRALVRIAEERSKLGEQEKARAAIAAAQHTISQLTQITEKSAAFAEVAKGLAQLHSTRLARAAVQSQAAPSDKLGAYTAILHEYAIERNPDLARFLAAEAAQ